MAVVITFGTFDLFHIGHLRLLERSRELGSKLVVGISSDTLNIAKKNRAPVVNQEARLRIVSALRCVDEVFFEESLELKKEYIKRYKADILTMGDDWAGKFDGMAPEVVYFKRTPSVSTTALIEKINA